MKKITMNGKEYTINPNIKYGLYRKIISDESQEDIEPILKAILKPKPTKTEIDNMDFEQIFRIMETFKEAMKEFLTETKKKLS